jgi:23S rRNA maturation mini-RNase III
VNERKNKGRSRSIVPKIFSLAVFVLALASIETHSLAGAQELFPKLRAIPACAAVAAAASTNSIPIAGTDPQLATNLLHSGDSVTILGTIFLKKKEAQWLLYIEAEKPGINVTNGPPFVMEMFGRKMSFESKQVPAKLQLLGPFEVSGNSHPKFQHQTAELTLNESFLGLGLERAAAVIYNQLTNSTSADNSKLTNRSGQISNPKNNKKLTPEEQRAVAGSIPALMSYLRIVEHTEGLEDLLYKLVKLPSPWSIVRHLGVNAGIYFGREALPANPADWNLPPKTPVYYLPCDILINDQPAARITLVVTTPNPPRLVCAGVVGVLAEKAGDDETYMTLRVISARCQTKE